MAGDDNMHWQMILESAGHWPVEWTTDEHLKIIFTDRGDPWGVTATNIISRRLLCIGCHDSQDGTVSFQLDLMHARNTQLCSELQNIKDMADISV